VFRNGFGEEKETLFKEVPNVPLIFNSVCDFFLAQQDKKIAQPYLQLSDQV
jgi:hypothetical protein